MGGPYSFPGTEGKQISIKTNLYPYKFDKKLVGYYQLQVIRTECWHGNFITTKVPAQSLPKYVKIFNETLPQHPNYTMVAGYSNAENVLDVYIIPPFFDGSTQSDVKINNHSQNMIIRDHTEYNRNGAPIADVRMVLEFKHIIDSTNELGDSEPGQFLKKVIMTSLGNILGTKYTSIGKHVYVTKTRSMEQIMRLDFLTSIVTGFKYRFHADIPEIQSANGNFALMSVNSAVNIVSRTDVSVLQYFIATVLNMPVDENNFNPEQFRGLMMNNDQKRRLLFLLQDLDVYISVERKKGNSRTYYNVTEISDGSASRLFVREKNGREIPVNEYYNQILRRDGKRIMLPDQCALFLTLKRGGTAKAVPFELVYVSDRPQRVKGNMENFRREFVTQSAIYPVPRFSMIQDFIDDLKKELRVLKHESILSKVSLKIHKDCIFVDGRVLERPELSDDEVLYAPFTSQIVDYVIIDLHDFLETEGKEYIENSMKKLVGIFRALKISFSEEPLLKCKRDIQKINVESELMEIVKKAKAKPSYNPNNKLFFFIIENDAEGNVHAQVKRVLHKSGYVSQVIRISTLDHIVGSRPRHGARYFDPVIDQATIVATQIAMKVNAKLGGTRVNVLESNSAWQNYLSFENATMFIGIDTRLPQRKDCIGRVGFVFSTDLTGMNYLAVVKTTDSVVYKYTAKMSGNLQEAIDIFRNNVGRPPKNIIIYRAGMNEYDIGNSRGEAALELAEIKKFLQEIGGDIPNVTYIGYHRSHNIRFMRTEFDPEYKNPDGNENDELKWNLPVGTVIDQKIVNPMCFFLVTHCAALGTTKPARYTIVCDDVGMTANDMLSLTYTLCSISPRCKKSIRRPLPIKLASLLLERSYEICPNPDERRSGRFGYEIPFHKDLRTLPFYV